jgi:hypothetical protein
MAVIKAADVNGKRVTITDQRNVGTSGYVCECGQRHRSRPEVIAHGNDPTMVWRY